MRSNLGSRQQACAPELIRQHKAAERTALAVVPLCIQPCSNAGSVLAAIYVLGAKHHQNVKALGSS